MRTKELKSRIKRAEKILNKRLVLARRWYNLLAKNKVNMSRKVFRTIYLELFHELRPDETANMDSVFELIEDKILKDEYDAILAMYPAFHKEVF